jgi:hypothetical protein
MLTETLFRIPFSVIGRCSLVPTSHWLQGKCAKINLSQAASGMIWFYESQAAFCKHFQFQNRCIRVFEACYWNFKIIKYTDRKMGLILRAREQMLKMQFSMARNFTFQPLRRYDKKPPKKTTQA